MVERVKTLDRRLLRRQCVVCGYDGTLLKGGQVAHCPRCNCDLRDRPARSYAEMEGLLGQPLTIDAPNAQQPRQERMIHKWLAFLFVAFLGFITILLLTRAAFAY